MSVVVYPKLRELLEAREWSVAELERRIEQRYGIAVDPKGLYRLTQRQPMLRADLRIVGAAASVLGVGLDALFEVQALSSEDAAARNDAVLDPTQSRRLAELFDRQARSNLTREQQQELEALVSEYGRRLHDRNVHQLAERRGIPVDEARQELDADLEAQLRWWQQARPGLCRMDAGSAPPAQARRRPRR